MDEFRRFGRTQHRIGESVLYCPHVVTELKNRDTRTKHKAVVCPHVTPPSPPSAASTVGKLKPDTRAPEKVVHGVQEEFMCTVVVHVCLAAVLPARAGLLRFKYSLASLNFPAARMSVRACPCMKASRPVLMIWGEACLLASYLLQTSWIGSLCRGRRSHKAVFSDTKYSRLCLGAQTSWPVAGWRGRTR